MGSTRTTMLRSCRTMSSNRLVGPRSRGLLLGVLAAVPLVAAPGTAAATSACGAQGRIEAPAPQRDAVALIGERLRGELRGVRTDEAVARLARLLGARLRWTPPEDARPVDLCLTGLRVEEALARLLGSRSYLLVLGERAEIQVLGAPASPRLDRQSAAGGPSGPALAEAGDELATMRRLAAVDEAAYARGAGVDPREALDAIVRGDDAPPVRLAAAERLLALDPQRAAAALAWLSSDRDDAVRARAAALLALAE